MQVSVKVALDVLSFPTIILLLLCTYEESDKETDECFHNPLNGESIKNGSVEVIYRKVKTKYFRTKICAESCDSIFLDQLNKQKQKDPSLQPCIEDNGFMPMFQI
jgi:ATP-binding cassette, subfamily C (CFTR/MRP), member 2